MLISYCFSGIDFHLHPTESFSEVSFIACPWKTFIAKFIKTYYILLGAWAVKVDARIFVF